MTAQTPGTKFRLAVHQERPLQVVGTINAYTAIQACRAGFEPSTYREPV
jgi:methylisocitrate lyase